MAKKQPIRLFMVDDSFFFLSLMQRELMKIEDVEIVGTARSADEAWDKIIKLKPDVITLDIEMPGESGIDFLKRFLRDHSFPIVLVSSLDMRLFDALQAGAVDYVRKPSSAGQTDFLSFVRKIENKIRIARLARVRRPTILTPMPGSLSLTETPKSALVVIGASTGGTEATAEIISGLPENMPPVLVVQHMPADFIKMYANRLDGLTRLTVKEAVDGEAALPNHVYLSPGGIQMTVHKSYKGYYLKCQPAEKRSGHCPSVDNLFDSAAACAGKHCLGVLLTGMGRDGAVGMLNIKKQGGYTIGQDEASCVVYGMPGEAKKIGAVHEEASCSEIASRIIDQLNRVSGS